MKIKYKIYKCKNCGIEFEAYIILNRKYCSKKCAAQKNKNIKFAKKPKTGIYKKCLTCNKLIYVQKYQGRNKKYCSKKCKANNPENIKKAIRTLKNIDNKGKKNPRYIDGRYIYRQAIFGLKENKCIICNKIKGLIAHHKNGNRYDNRINNIMIICYSCHLLIHKLENKTNNEKRKILYYSKQLKKRRI